MRQAEKDATAAPLHYMRDDSDLVGSSIDDYQGRGEKFIVGLLALAKAWAAIISTEREPLFRKSSLPCISSILEMSNAEPALVSSRSEAR